MEGRPTQLAVFLVYQMMDHFKVLGVIVGGSAKTFDDVFV